MANIYLRVPTIVAQFYRGRDVKNPPKQEKEPIVFSKYEHEYVLLESSLVIVNGVTIKNSACFSQREWRNMMRGKSPDGSMQVLQRDSDEWLLPQDVCVLLGERVTQKTDGYDYLCIEIPRTILVAGEYVSTNASFALPPFVATQLVSLLRTEMIRVFLDHVRQERFWCNQHGIRRELSTVVDHFFYHYHMCIGANGRDRESMRRQSMRWIEESLTLPNDRLPWDDDDAMYLYEKECDLKDKDIPKLLKELNVKNKSS